LTITRAVSGWSGLAIQFASASRRPWDDFELAEQKGSVIAFPDVKLRFDNDPAVLGGEIRVPTLAGNVNLKIPEGSQNGQTFRLRGKGMPKLNKPNEYGDLYARLDVRLPTRLTPEQRKLFEQLRQQG
jgi:DnaJ-class molecular chaperone